jgi:uptake hydrogenase large subunit
VAALDLTVGWRSGVITGIRVHDARPQPGRLLIGATPAAALALLGRLYAVCGRAQRACAELALAAAGGLPLPGPRRLALARAVGCEAVQEHLWRLLLDWPAKLGLAPLTGIFKHWHARIGADEPGWAEALLADLADRTLGVRMP